MTVEKYWHQLSGPQMRASFGWPEKPSVSFLSRLLLSNKSVAKTPKEQVEPGIYDSNFE